MLKKENETQGQGEGQVQEKKNDKNEEKKEIEKIKSDVDKLSQDLKTAVSELKKSIVDIRSAVSEIENPFNLLRVISSEKDLKKLNNERLPPGVKSLIIGKPVEETEEKAEEEPSAPSLQASSETLGIEPKEEQTTPKVEPPMPTGTAYLDWVWSLLDLGFSPEDVKQLADSYVLLGFLPSHCSRQVYALAVAAEKAKSKGLSKGRLLLNMYKASVVSGIKIGLDDVKTLISIAERKLKRPKVVKGAA
ncbi:MAG: hypothetical protein QW667_07890 [Candidatus Bathyarchaeia archaeon]